MERELDKNAWSELGMAEQRVLGAVFHKYAGQSFSSLLSPEEWAAEGLSGVEARLAFTKLLHKRWVYSIPKSWGERLFYIPAHLMEMLTGIYASKIGRAIEPLIGQPLHLIHESRPHIAAELLHIAAWIEREGLPLTVKGTIHKRTVQKLSTLTKMASADFEGLGIQHEHAELYPVHVAILLDLLLCLDLLKETDGELRLINNRLQDWVQLSWGEMYREIYQACMERYGKNSPALQHIRYQLAVLAPGEGVWSRITKQDDEPEIKSWLYALAGWGYIEIGEDEVGGLAFRWCMEPDILMCSSSRKQDKQEADWTERAGFYVQPDFEIMIPPDVPPRIWWGLEHCCERVTLDQMSIYRLSKERIFSTINNGERRAEDIIAFMHQFALTGVPEHVLVALKDWGTNMESEVPTVPMQDRRLLYSKGCSRHDQDKDIFLEHSWQDAKAQFFYRSDIQGLVQSYASLRGLTDQLNAGYVTTDDKSVSVIPDMDDIPDNWHKEWRRYHQSTARQIATKAIEWQTKLGVKRGSDTYYLIPHQIEGYEHWTLNGWNISGYSDASPMTEWRTFSPSEWDSMRIILPDDVLL